MLITKNLHRVFAVSVLAGLVLAAVIMSSVVHAQSTGLGFTPRKDVTAQAGKSVDGTLFINNLDKKSAITLQVQVVDFTSVNQTGAAALSTDNNADPTPWSLRPFLNVPKSITLQPGESKQVPFTVAIPKDQGAGSYYSVVQYTAETKEGQQVKVSASAASMVFVTVPGKAREQLSLQQFGPYTIAPNATNGTFQSLFVSKQPTKVAFVLRNSGSVAEMPAGSIEITNVFGKQIRVIKNANPKSNVALIGQERRFEVCIRPGIKQVKDSSGTLKVEYCKDPNLPPGIYKAHLSLLYGINGSHTQEIDKTVIFWYLPVWSIVVLVLIIAVVAFGLYKLRTVYTRYQARNKA